MISNYLGASKPSDPKKFGEVLDQAMTGEGIKAPPAKDPNEKSIAEILKSCKDENEFVQKVLSRKDGLNHLLLSDVNALMMKMQAEFPQYVKVSSIGQSYEGREINMLEITAPSPKP